MILRQILLVVTTLLPSFYADYLNGCSSHCTLTQGRDSEECWDETSNYFQVSLLGQMRNFVNVEMGIAQWRKENGKEMDWDAAREDTVGNMDSELPPDIEDEDGLTDRDLYNSVIGALIQAAKEKFDEDPTREPVVNCPHGCEKPSDAFFWLFCASSMFTLLLAIAMVSILYALEYKDDQYVDLIEETQKQKKRQQAAAPS